VRCNYGCPLWAKSGHRRYSISRPRLKSQLALSRFLRRGAIAIDESYQFFGRLGEQLELSRIQRLAQELKQESVSAIQESWPQAAEEKAETACGIRAYLLEIDHAIATIVDLDTGSRFLDADGRWFSHRYRHTKVRVNLEQHLLIYRRGVNRACEGLLHEAEGAEIALSLSCGRAGYILGSETLRIGAEQHSADWHAGSLVVALRKGMDRERLGINSDQALRAIAVLVAAIALRLPMLRFLPTAYNWLTRRRLFYWYAQLKALEASFDTDPTGKH
jgi:hypothetical protein